ncbi:hypothetical protein LIN78_06480 [Leeia sp. TBRC 13508]|uniref:FimV N-terminal domain-containing protein n=1 Tax=Leeia speluncae TaxID=2884804 RepID=A0ABS8D4U0_9NEIS|nr:hypothetical protein [Leeia speluncae]MCB6183186.1 hypothetical protein [Leeia speluncae]
MATERASKANNTTTVSLLKRLAVFVVSAIASADVVALQLGDIQVKSSLGYPFSAVIPVKLKDDEVLDAACVRLLQEGRQDSTYIRQASLTVQRNKNISNIVIHTSNRIDEPLVRLAISVNCNSTSTISREYPILLDPPSVVEAAQAPKVLATPSVKATDKRFPGRLRVARNGDTFQSIAAAIYANDPAAQDAFVRQMLSRYPDVANANEVLESGRRIYLVKVKTAAERIKPQAPKPAPTQTVSKPVVAAPSAANVAPENVQPTDRLELSSAESGNDDFSLKLSYSLAPSTKNLTPAEKEALKQKLQLINSDDQLSYLIDLQTQLKQVHQEMDAIRNNRPVVAATSPASEESASQTSVFSNWHIGLPSDFWWMMVGGLLLIGVAGGGYYVYRQRKQSNEWSFDDYVPPVADDGFTGAQSLILPADALDSDYATTGKPAVEDVSNDFTADVSRSSSILVEDSERWAVEEAQVFLAHGWVDHAVSLLKEEIDKNQYHLDLWIMLFDVYKQNQMVDEFDALAVQFKEIAFGLPLWDQVVNMQNELRASAAHQKQSEDDIAALDAALDLDLASNEGSEGLTAASLDTDPLATKQVDTNELPFESVWLTDDAQEDVSPKGQVVEDGDVLDIFEPVLLPETSAPNSPVELTPEAVELTPAPQDALEFEFSGISLAPQVKEADVDAENDVFAEQIDYSNIDLDLSLDLPDDPAKKDK